MTVSLTLVRVVRHTSIDTFNGDTLREYHFIELYLMGFAGKRGRNRIKRVSSFPKARSYLIRLSDSDFMVPGDLTDALSSLYKLAGNCEPEAYYDLDGSNL